MSGFTTRFNYLIKILSIIILSNHCNAQDTTKAFTLEQLIQFSESNYPSIKKNPLLKETEELNIKNINTSFLPNISINGQATYQSDVTQVNVPVPGFKIDPLSKDQYRVTADINQLIYDGGISKEQTNLQHLNTNVEEAKVNVELYQVKNRVTQLYLLILYNDELFRQTDLLIKDIEIGINKVTPQVQNGVTLKSNLYVLEAQLLQTKQRTIEIKNTRDGYLKMLSIYAGRQIDNVAEFKKSEVTADTTAEINRPEIELYQRQKELLERQKKLVDAQLHPKASLFLQSGYGRPGLNMLSNKFDAFYITGLRFNWSLSSLYSSKRDKRLLDVNQSLVDIEKENFILKTKEQLIQQNAEIEKFNELIISDKSILELRKKITESAKAQLENNVITVSDYLREINAEDQTRQSLIIHQLQLFQAQINYQIISGKL